MTGIGQLKFDASVRYSKERTWARPEGDLLLVGISDFAQDHLGEIIFIDFPQTGDVFDRDKEFGVVESAKTSSELYMPLGGEIVEVNSELEDKPEIVNQAPYAAGWLIKIQPEDASAWETLLSAEEYKQQLT
jgi:glycine cleavage system H protein